MKEQRLVNRYSFALLMMVALSGCDPMALHHVSIPYSMADGDVSVVVENDDVLRDKLKAIDTILISKGLFAVAPTEGAFRTYDSEESPSESRGSFVYVDVVIDPEGDNIAVTYQAFPASPSSGEKLLLEIEEAVEGIHNNKLQPIADAPAE